MKSIFERLLTVAKCANGVFISGILARNKSEKDALNSFIRNNSSYFRRLFDGPSYVYQLTQEFYKNYIFDMSSDQNMSQKLIIQSLAWGAFCLDNSVEKKIFTDVNLGPSRILIDDFSQINSYSLESCIVTIPIRSSFFKEFNIEYMIPDSLYSKWVFKSINILFSKFKRNFSDEYMYILSNGDKRPIQSYEVLTGAIWPRNEEECHKDERVYPGHSVPLNGREKWKLDKIYLDLNKTLNSDYKLGVYPR